MNVEKNIQKVKKLLQKCHVTFIIVGVGIERLEAEGAKLAIVKMGGSTAVPIVHNTIEQIVDRFDITCINHRESLGSKIELPMGVVEVLTQIV